MQSELSAVNLLFSGLSSNLFVLNYLKGTTTILYMQAEYDGAIVPTEEEKEREDFILIAGKLKSDAFVSKAINALFFT